MNLRDGIPQLATLKRDGLKVALDRLLLIGAPALMAGLFLPFYISEFSPTEAVTATGQLVPFDNHGVRYVRWYEALACNVLLVAGFSTVVFGAVVRSAIFGVDKEGVRVWLRLISYIFSVVIASVMVALFLLYGGHWPFRFSP
jgi:hypothetical protein